MVAKHDTKWNCTLSDHSAGKWHEHTELCWWCSYAWVDLAEIRHLKIFLCCQAHIKGAKFATWYTFLGSHRSPWQIVFLEKVSNLLEEKSKLGKKGRPTPIDWNIKLGKESSEILNDWGKFEELHGSWFIVSILRREEYWEQKPAKLPIIGMSN